MSTARPMRLDCFKTYDIRGRLGDTLDAGIAGRIARAVAEALEASRVVLARDCRRVRRRSPQPRPRR
jgi:phosphomannomutase